MSLFLALLLVACHPDDSKPSDSGSDTAAPTAPWPDWTWTHWVWENESTQESALQLVQGYLDHDIPVGAVIIDSPWATGYSTYEFDPARFPDPQAMIDQFHAQGVRVFLWTVPVINVEVKDLYAVGASNSWFLQHDAKSGPAVVEWWKGEGSLIDYFNPDAVAWWHSLMDEALDLGIDGWKCDGADYYAILEHWSPGLGADVARLDYSHAYYQDTFDYTRQVLGDDRIITSRPVDNYGSGLGGEELSFTPQAIAWASWVGDQDATFGGLKAALNNMYLSAELGYLAFGSDIGGFRTEDEKPLGREKEVFIRWAQLGAFCPVMENGGSGEHRPWVFDDETDTIYRRFVLLHEALLPYLKTQGARAFAENRSLMAFQDDEAYAFLLGDDVFVAPILEEGTLQATVTLPEGEWVFLFDETRSSGAAEITVDVPLRSFPVFVREGSEIAAALSAALLAP